MEGFAAAGSSTFFVIPFTLASMIGINNKLLAASDSGGGEAKQ
jgi:hypothetical protein